MLFLVAFGAGILVSSWVLSLDRIVVSRFEGRRFSVPTKVFSAPTILYPGLDARRIDLRGTLQRLGYREQAVQGGRPLRAGLYRWEGARLRVHLHAFEHPSRAEPARDIVIRLDDGVIGEIRELPRSREVGAVLLEPELVGAYYGVDREQRELVGLAEVPTHLTDAILAVEDRRFETHHGIDVPRIGGALLANLRAGGVRQGASTLTQQLVKNFFLTPERTLRRKAQEAIMALLVEARYDKSAILQAYLNEIYLGQRGSTAIHGVGEASHFYFGKAASELTVAESATLAAIIQSPNRLSPHRNSEDAVERRNLVLELMRKQGRIDLATFENARSEQLHVAPITIERGESRYFLDALRRQLPEVYDQSVLEVEGLRIYSTLDPRLQRAATKALVEGIESIESLKPELRSDDPARQLQGCLLAMRPQTGEILALVGGRSYGGSQFDRCTQARRPAGSVFKPFAYVAALEPRGGVPVITLASILDDTPLEVKTRQGLWQPANYDHEFRGPVSVREALERSLNVPSARLAMEVGIGRVADMARRLGITSPLPHVPSLALGTADVAPVEIARAYATLANRGIRPVPHTFEDVVSAGQTLERRTLAFERVLDPGTAFLAVSLLEGVVERGTARRLRSMGFRGPIAGKTGTTDEERDLWFVGFTPELVAVVWLGFDEPRSIGVSSSAGPLPIWANFARDVFGTQARGAFLPPPEVEQMEIEPRTGALALSGCRDHRPEYFVVGTQPSETCPRGGQVGGSGRGQRRGVLRWLDDLL
ncbi:MAG: PBP1A family penicillin-binding protein [Deltaproteobacteria bacterium]|nr:PBP1A family penicillin-binding protein [Deltaproteobacteria bacterium]